MFEYVCMHVCNQGLYVYINVSAYVQTACVCRHPRKERVWVCEQLRTGSACGHARPGGGRPCGCLWMEFVCTGDVHRI